MNLILFLFIFLGGAVVGGILTYWLVKRSVDDG